MHVPDVAEVILPSRVDADALLPAVDEIEDLLHDRARERRRPLGEAADELIKKLLGRDLEVEGVSAGLDESLEQCEGEHGDVGIAVVNEPRDGHRRFAGAAFRDGRMACG